MNLPAAFSGNRKINAIIETPRGSRNKYTFEQASGLFLLKKILPQGLFFPLDFGFIPQTKAGDGDPVDVMVFMDEPAFPGCLIECRVIGIIMAKQEKKSKMIRNDRVLAVAEMSTAFANLQNIEDVNKETIVEVTRFFEVYHEKEGNKFKSVGIGDAEKAINLIKENLIA